MPGAARSSDGRWPITYAQSWCWTRWRWRSVSANRPTSFIIAIKAASTGLPPEEWRGEIRASCGHGDADFCHVRPRLNGRLVANPRMQALPIIEDLDVIEHRCFGFLAGSEAALVHVLFLE